MSGWLPIHPLDDRLRPANGAGGGKHLAEAHQLAKNLADRLAIYRPPRPSRFVRLTCETEGMTEIIMLPLIGNILVMPVFAGIGLTGGWGATPPAVNVKSLALARILLRLRPRGSPRYWNRSRPAQLTDKRAMRCVVLPLPACATNLKWRNRLNGQTDF